MSQPQPDFDGQREQAIARVQQAYAQGQLSYDSLTQRLDLALSAESGDGLAAAVAALPTLQTDREVAIHVMNGRIRRDGPWRVPARMRIESDYAKVRLDLSSAVFEADSLDLELQLRFGRAKIIVPMGAVVDLDGLQTVWKQPSYRVPTRAAGGGPVIRITGSMEYGKLRIRHRKQRR